MSNGAVDVGAQFSQEEWDEIKNKKRIAYGMVKFDFQDLEGKILTLIDSSIQDPEQRKAMKDIARSIFKDKHNSHYDWMVRDLEEESKKKSK